MLKKFGKKSLLIASGIAIALVAVIIAIAVVLSKGEATKKIFIPDSELARAMTYDQFTDADSSVDGTDYVKFGAFFLRDINNDGYAEKIKGTCKQVGKEDTLYMELNVLTNGYLENGVITINSDNFYLQTAIPKDSEIKDNVISNNTKQISLNQINNGTQKLLTGIVRTGDYSYDSQRFAAIENDTTKMSRVNSVTLTGTHVAADGTRTQISKTVEFNMDWYGTTKTEIPNYMDGEPNLNQSKDNTDIVHEDVNTAVFDFNIGIQEVDNQLTLSKACIEGELPQLNGYNPTGVGSLDKNVQISYDNKTRKFVMSKSAELNEDGTIKRQCYDNSSPEKKYNKFMLRVIYPLEAYNAAGADAVELKIPINAYYEGFNNDNSEFSNPYQSEPAKGTIILTYKNPNGNVAIFNVWVGKYINIDSEKYIVSKKKPLNIYNGISATEQNDVYTVLWKAETGSGGQSEGITMKETKNDEAQVSDKFIKADASTESMSDVTSNIGIYFSNPVGMLGENGWIKIYNDETDELVYEFNKENWSKYNERSPYKYESAVKHIRIVTSATNKNESLYAYNVKCLDDEYITNNYSRSQFDDLKYVKSSLTGYIEDNYVNTDTKQASYETPYSLTRISLNKTAISTQETEKDLEITISTSIDKAERYNQEEWRNGIFLVKLPEDIIDAKINDIELSSNSVSIVSQEVYSDENGQKFLKIITSNKEANFFDLVVKCTVSADPRILTKTEKVELYAHNEDASDYYSYAEDIYDINGNLNVTENVNKTSTELILISPNSLLTSQIAVNYDEKGSVAVAPQIAIVSKERRTATVNVEISNNYSSTISDVVIIGRTPFKDNKYTLNKNEMGSTFTAAMTYGGITLPSEIKNVANVYYSENGEATKDLTDKSNGWTKTPTDYSKVRSYLVDFSNHEFSKGETYTISYDISIPAGLDYNQVSYSHHAVYFSLDTSEGKYKTQTEPNKVGFMIAKQYDLEVIKYQTGKDKKVGGATYAIYEDGSDEAKTKFTDSDGKFTLSELFVGRTYVIKEVRSPNDYELNEELVKFTTSEIDGKLSITNVEGNVKNINVIDSTEKVQVQLEDEVRAKLKVLKVDKDTSVGLKNIKYKLTGKGINNPEKILTTDTNGEVLLSGLYIGEEYTLEEVKADGYYLAESPIKFVVNNNGEYTVNVSSGEVKEVRLVEDNDIPVVNLKIEDEKIPTYNLEINKVVKGETTPLSNVKFAIESKDSGKIAYYTTDEIGKINIQGLYQYKNDKSNTAEYILKEITTPEGYSTMKDVTFRVENNNGNLQVNVLSGDVKETSSNGTNVSITVENAPIFTLTKRDKDTNELIPNTEFRIYNINDNDFARDIDGNYVGIHEKYSQIPLKSVGDYGWKKNSDGTLQSENYHIGTSKSTLKAEIEIMEKGKLDFDWSVSSESPNFDYFYVEIKNLKDDSQVYYDKIEGTEYGTEYSELQYTHKTIELEPGRYSLEFTYIKDTYTDAGLDSGFLKNITIDTDIYSPYYYVKTDDEGKINLKLQSGVYKAVETKSNEMYQFSENENKRTYYFGIDESKDGVDGLLVDGYLFKESNSRAYVKCITKTSDGGYVMCVDFYSKLIITDDTIFEAESNGKYDTSIIKYSSDDKVEWAKHIGSVEDVVINDIEQTSDDGIVLVGGSTGKKVNIADELILTQNTKNKMGFILKYNNNGDLLWSSKTELEFVKGGGGASASGGATYIGMRRVVETSDGMYLVSQQYGGESTYNMKLQNGTILKSFGEADVALIKFNKDGEIIFSDTIGSEYSESNNSIIAISNGGYIVGIRSFGKEVTEIEATGTKIVLGPAVGGYTKSVLIKYNKDNEVESYITNSENERFDTMMSLSTGEYFITGVLDSKGFVKRYDSNNNLVWNVDFDDDISKIFKGINNGCFVTSDDNLYFITDKGEIKYNHSFKYLSSRILDGELVDDNRFIATGCLSDASIEMSNGKTLIPNPITTAMVLEYSIGTVENEINSMKQLTVYNEKKKYNITTKVDGNIGGSITGDGEKPFEIVAYNEDSVKDIIMKPDEGYQIEKVTINGENCDFIDNNDGTYTINKFKNMLEDKEVIVKYANKDSCLEINKTDEKTGEAISGVEFNVKQDYNDKALENVLGELKNDNGILSKYYYTGADLENPKELTWENVGNYYFVESNGKYIPTNGKTYRESLGESTGISYSTAHSYIKIDLSDMEGSYLVKVNASCSSYKYNCYGYAKVTENENESSYYGSAGRFMDISGTLADRNYVSNALEGGKVYYLHFWYDKGSKEDGDDQVVINSVKLIHFDSSECGEPISNSDYEFVKTDSGTYIPTNGKKYQESIGKSSGVQASRAESIVEIDLTDKTGDYAVGVTAKASTEIDQDFGYAMLTQDTEVVQNISSGFMYISGEVASKTYFSNGFIGGSKYYLHLGYKKDSNTDYGDDSIEIEKITLYPIEAIEKGMTKIDGKYKINANIGSYETAHSYIPLDLTKYNGEYLLKIQAEVNLPDSSEAYIHLAENMEKVSSYITTNRIFYLKGVSTENTEYVTKIQGGKVYYIQIGYYGRQITLGNEFTINSINVYQNPDNLYNKTVRTDENGKAVISLGPGKYNIEETKPADGYVLNDQSVEVDINQSKNYSVNITNKQTARLLVHHYLKGTTTKLADDEISDSEVGVAYSTSPKLDLGKYELEKDSNGTYILPENAAGTYVEGTTEVTYYYVEKQIPLTVHHYIEGTTDKVPLKAGGTASDVTGIGKEGESYITSAIADDKLSDEYELVENPLNANGTYNGNEVVVTYYYKKVARDVNLVKYKEDGKTPLAGARFTIDGQEYITDSNGKITTNLEFGTYDVTETEAPDGYKLPSNPTTKVTITKATPETINITNEKKTGTVTVHHYIEGTTDKVPLADGGTADDEVKTGNIGDIYATKIVDNLSEGYELSLEPSNGSGTYIDGNIEVIYYYKSIPTSVLVHHYLEGTTTKLVDDVIHDGIVGDNYTTGVATVDSKYEVVAIPANANGKMTREQIVVIYYYRVKDTSVLVHHYKEGTSESLSKDVTITGKVDDAYTTSVASDIPSKYELVATPTNARGKMTVAQTVVTYYYRLKSTGVDVHYYKEGTTEKVSKDVAIEGKVDQAYTTSPATDVESKYELVGTPANATGTMTESRITVIYYYRLKDTSVLVHHYLEGTTTKLADDVTIKGKVDSSYKTVANTELLAGKYELVADPTNKSGTMTEAQIVVIYYYRVKDTSVLVHHYIKGTTTKLSEDVTIKGKIDDKYTTTIADDIPEQYELVAEPTNKSGTMTEEQIVVTYYYQLKNYPYTVNYLEKGTNKILHDAKQGGALTYGSTVKSSDEKIDIDGYNYDSVDKETLTIGITGNVINIYYTKRIDLSYKVNYLEKGTNKVLHDQKVQNGMTFESTVTSANEVIDIDGYNYDSVDKDTLKITTGENVINIYYTKRNDLSYTVNYLEKDTNKVLHNPKNQTGMTFGEIITSSDEIIEIDGYDYDSVDKNSIAIGTSENVINIYYTKRTDLSYKVNYLEKGTNKVLHDQKVQGGMTFESVVDSSKEVININGYNYDSVDKVTLKITTGENVINIYYTKKTDLSYKVNYLEKTTNKVLHDQKVQDGMTFESVVTSADEVIDIDGYNYDSVDKDTLIITTGENVINIYYTKKTDLSYRVNYLEKGTNKVLYSPKTQDGMTFESTVTSANEVIDIDGYNYDSVDKDTLIITTGENVINIYYTKRNDLSYKVNYLEKGTNKVLHNPKVQDGMTFESTVNSADEVIDIDGYDYDSADKDKLVIGTGENVINIYYTKRTDLSYKVNYLEKGTNKVLHDQKVQDEMTFESVVTSANEVIDIDGYNYDSVDKDTLTITTGENVINIYYTKKNDLSYKVNYLEKGTNKVLHNPKTQDEMTFESVVNSSDEVISIYGYNYDSVDKDTLTITTGENVINIYYTKKDTKVTVHYYEEGTTNKVSEDVEIPGKVFDNYETESASDIPSKYELVEEPENKNGTMTEDEITVIYYYRKKATQVIVHYYEENTTKKLSEDVTINGRVDDKYTTISATDIPIKYELVAAPSNANGSMTEATIEVIYYYRIKDAVVHVRYLEKGTDIVLADPDRIDGKVDEDYQTMPKEIDGYQLVEHTGNEKGKFEVEPLTITYYYLYKTKATVQYIDKITGQILEQSTTEGLEGDDFVTESKDFENYVLVEEPAEKTVKMTKEEQILKYYYIHISGGVIEKHIDVISGQILANKTYEGNEGDTYDIPSRTFDGYELVEDRLPNNAKGTMKVEPVEVIYYYIYRTKVTSEYIDKNTGEKLTEDVTQNGHEGDNYTTDRKTFDDYKLVEVPANADGSMTKEDIKVTYYYVHTSGGVIVNHIDIKTGKQLLDETKEEGYEGDPYETHEENIPEYDLVKEKYPENATGKMTIEPTRVTYYYIKKTEVNVKYVDKETGEEIDEPTNIPGHEGDDYTTEPKDVPGYDLIEEPENKDGTMTADPIDVIYYYKRPAKVIVNYYDIDTKEKLADEIEITGHQNDDYTTEQKDIKYYEIAKVPENKEGKMVVTVTKDENDEEIVDDTTYVNYYYRKLIFNLRVDKTIVSVIVNGQETGINGTLGKVEVHRKNISTANVKVVYKIKVTNDSELSGKANVVENIPSGMTMLSENNPDWTIKETTASLETDEIKPGESREYQVVLGWQNGDNNVGTKTNMVSITTENEADFDEQFETDNVSKADLIVAVGTGEVPYAKIAGGILLIMISITAGVYVISKKRQ